MIRQLVDRHDVELSALKETTAVFKEVARTLSEFVRNSVRKEEKFDAQILELHRIKEDRK